MPVVVQRQVSVVQKAMEAPQMQAVLKAVEDPQLQIVEKTADGRTETPEIRTVRGTQTSKSLGIVPEHRLAQAERVKVDKIGAPLFYRIRFTHIRHSVCLGKSSSCCWVCKTRSHCRVRGTRTRAHGRTWSSCCRVRDFNSYRCLRGSSDHNDSGASSLPTTTVPVFMQKTAATPPVKFVTGKLP